MVEDVAGNCIMDPNGISNLIVNHYNSLFASELQSQPPNIMSTKSINYSEVPTMLEVKEAIFSIGGSKALGVMA